MNIEAVTRQSNLRFISPDHLLERIRSNLITADSLLFDTFRPHYNYFGKDYATIDGVYLPDQTDKKERSFTLIDFSKYQDSGLNLLTLFAISAALQGTRISVIKKCDDWGIAKEERPMSYDDFFKEKLESWIKQAGKISSETSFREENKVSFYLAISEMMNIVLKGINPGEAFNYFMDSRTNLTVGFSIFSNFFPHIAEKIDEKAIYTLLNNGYEFEDVLRGFVKNDLERFFDIDSGIELAFLLQFPPDTIKTLVKLQKDHTSLDVDWSLSKEKIIEEINKLFSGEKVEIVDKEKKEKTEYDFPKPEQFGMETNRLETQLMRDYFKEPKAVVISPEQIRKNPAAFWRYQEALIRSIADGQGIIIDPSREIPYPKEPPSLHDEELFRDTEKHLKQISEWLWLLLYPSVQEEFFKRLPYTAVPPYVNIDGKAIPVSNENQKEIIFHYFDDHPFTEEGRLIVNKLPFLNYFQIGYKDNKIAFIQTLPTIPGKFIRRIIDNGGFVFLDHGIARWVLGDWGEKFPLDTAGYKLDENYVPPAIDVDMLVFHLNKTAGEIAEEVSHGTGLVRSWIKGRSMRDLSWTFIAKPPNVYRRPMDPYLAAHDKYCIMQALEGWQAGNTKTDTNLLIETLIGFSRLRTPGLYVELISEESGKTYITVKAVDLFGGLIDYTECGGGIVVNGKKKNVITFPYLERAFPEKQTYSIWHVLRTVAEIFHTTGGAVILRQAVLNDSYHQIDKEASIKAGTNQFRDQIVKAGKYLSRIRLGDEQLGDEHLGDIYLEDLRRELLKNAEGMIEKDLNRFLLVCSGSKYEDASDYLSGLELSLFYPHIHVLRKDAVLWQKILDNLGKLERKENEPSLEFLARALLTADKSLVLHTAGHIIEEEFIRNPQKVGFKLLMQKESDAIDVQRSGYRKNADWQALALDSGSFLGRFAYHWHSWTTLLNDGIDREWLEKKLSEKDLIHIISEYKLTQGKFRLETNIYGKDVPESVYIYPKILEDRQKKALADWLIDPGF